MQSFMALFLTYILTTVCVNSAPIPQPQLNGLPLGDITGSAAGPSAIAGEVISAVEGLTTSGGILKRQLSGLTSLISDPTAIISTVESLPGDVSGSVDGLGGGGLLKRQLDGVGNLLSDPTAIVSEVVSTVEGLADSGLGNDVLKRQLGGIDAAAVVPNLLQSLDLGPVGDVVADVESTVENAAGGL